MTKSKRNPKWVQAVRNLQLWGGFNGTQSQIAEHYKVSKNFPAALRDLGYITKDCRTWKWTGPKRLNEKHWEKIREFEQRRRHRIEKVEAEAKNTEDTPAGVLQTEILFEYNSPEIPSEKFGELRKSLRQALRHHQSKLPPGGIVSSSLNQEPIIPLLDVEFTCPFPQSLKAEELIDALKRNFAYKEMKRRGWEIEIKTFKSYTV